MMAPYCRIHSRVSHTAQKKIIRATSSQPRRWGRLETKIRKTGSLRWHIVQGTSWSWPCQARFGKYAHTTKAGNSMREPASGAKCLHSLEKVSPRLCVVSAWVNCRYRRDSDNCCRVLAKGEHISNERQTEQVENVSASAAVATNGRHIDEAEVRVELMSRWYSSYCCWKAGPGLARWTLYGRGRAISWSVPVTYRTRRREGDGLEEAKKIEGDTGPSDQAAAWHVTQNCVRVQQSRSNCAIITLGIE